MPNFVLNHISSIGCCNPLVTMLNKRNFGFPYSFLPRFSPPAFWCRDFHSRDFHPCIFATPAFSTPTFSAAPPTAPATDDNYNWHWPFRDHAVCRLNIWLNQACNKNDYMALDVSNGSQAMTRDPCDRSEWMLIDAWLTDLLSALFVIEIQ